MSDDNVTEFKTKEQQTSEEAAAAVMEAIESNEPDMFVSAAGVTGANGTIGELLWLMEIFKGQIMGQSTSRGRTH